MNLNNISEKFTNYLDYDEIVNEICKGYISLDFEEYNTRLLIHSLIKDQDMQMMFLKEEICYINKIEMNIKYLTA